MVERRRLARFMFDGRYSPSLWDTRSWNQFKVISTGDKWGVKLAVAWASDSRRVAAASFNARIWEAANS